MRDRPIVPIRWRGQHLEVLDQRELPHREVVIDCRTLSDVCHAIRTLAVRGAPLLGITAAHGLALVAAATSAETPSDLIRELERAGDDLMATRPTAVNIGWAAARVLAAARASGSVPGATVGLVVDRVSSESAEIEREDAEACDAIGAYGAELIPSEPNILTHCNTGMLCTGGIGTAQGVIFVAHRAGKRVHVWVDETRPLWQGARLTAWELGRLGIPRTLIADSAAAGLMAVGRVDLVITGADRIASDGSVANKVGTYALAVLARHHGLPFYVAAPTSTIDTATPTGADIPIEERGPEEVLEPGGVEVAEAGTPASNPAFDVTPPELVTALITERGVVRTPSASRIRRLLEGRKSA